jgi:hypothetical protein
MEATGGFEPPMGVLQTPALPLGDVAVLKTKYWCRGRDLNSHELTLTTPSRWRVYHSTTSAKNSLKTKMAGVRGFEPLTGGFGDHCSTS